MAGRARSQGKRCQADSRVALRPAQQAVAVGAVGCSGLAVMVRLAAASRRRRIHVLEGVALEHLRELLGAVELAVFRCSGSEMKLLFLYTDGNDPKGSDLLRNAAKGIPFQEIRLDKDLRIHDTKNPGVIGVIEIDGRVIIEVFPDELQDAWATSPDTLPTPDPPQDPFDRIRKIPLKDWSVWELAEYLTGKFGL